MNIYEYQAKGLLKQYGVMVQDGYLVESLDHLEAQARKVQSDTAAIKAQIHAGGRSKAGGVKIVETLTDALDASRELLNKRLVTDQTGVQGEIVRKVYIEECCTIEKEFYVRLSVDQSSGNIALVYSKEGGTKIEEVAQSQPDAVEQCLLNPVNGLTEYQLRSVAKKLDLTQTASKCLYKTLDGMYRCFWEKDCSMIEINPLILTPDETLIALDAKIAFDENAFFRQPEVFQLREFGEEDPKQLEASSYGVSYIEMDGEIGCLVNGAGLAMATMDAIYMAGGSPANFLDVGGSADVDTVAHAFRIALSNTNVKGIFVNIFGGMMHCDTIARGILKALISVEKEIPLVVRLQGTRADEGKCQLKESGYKMCFVDSVEEGADAIVKLVEGER